MPAIFNAARDTATFNSNHDVCSIRVLHVAASCPPAFLFAQYISGLRLSHQTSLWMEVSMKQGWHTVLIGAALTAGFALPARAQHEDLTPKALAKAEVESRHEREHHHNKLKEVGGGTVVGAVAGGAVAGPAGAFAGAKLGHSGGGLFHGFKERKEVKRQMAVDRARRARRARALHHRTAAAR